MLRRLCIFLIMLTAFVQLMRAQDGKLSGRVFDDKGMPAPYATVMILKGDEIVNGANADDQGAFEIQPVEPGTYDVQAEIIGATVKLTGVTVNSGQTRFIELRLPLAKDATSETVEIVEFKIPVFEKDPNAQGKTVTGEDVRRMGSRNINIVAATTPGVFQSDEGDFSLNFRGARDGSTVYIIDGQKVRGSPNLPQTAIGEMQIITGGTPAEFGDFTGGAVNITTSSPSRKLMGGGELLTSELLDAYGTHIYGLNIGGPILKKEIRTNPDDPNTAYKRTVLGFFASGEYNFQRDADPAYTGIYKLADEKLADLQANPVVYNPTLTTFVNRANDLNANDLIKVKAKANNQLLSLRLAGRLDFQPADNIQVKLGGSFEGQNSNNATWDLRNMLLAPNANALYKANSYRVWTRFQQSFKSDKDALVQNFFYSLQADYSLFKRTFEHRDFGNNLWDYGYYGKFDYDRVPFYQYVTDPVNSQYSSGPYWETIGYGFANLRYDRTGTRNEVLSNTNDYIFNYVQNNGIQIPGTGLTINDLGDPNLLSFFNGNLNGSGARQIYSLFSGLGSDYGAYRLREQSQARVIGQATAQIKRHNIKFGFEFEQRVERDYTLGARSLWFFARQYANRQLQGLDRNAAVPIIRNGEFQDTVMLPVAYDSNLQTRIDTAIRNQLGIPLNSTQWVNTDALTPEFFNAKPLNYWFTFGDISSNGQGALGEYYGYTYYGTKMRRVNPEEFFRDTVNRPQNPFAPTYISAFIQDKFELEDIIFNLGLRVDRFDANQYILKDNFSLRETYSAAEAANLLNLDLPSNVQGTWVPYVDDIKNPKKFLGFRDGEIWYDANGLPVSSAQIAQSSGGQVKPYVKGDETKLTFGAFRDYVPQIVPMPRLSFSFPIAENALFFAHYDVLSQRPGQLRANEASLLAGQFTDYLFLPTNPTISLTNPNLKPEVTIDYEAGFRQKIGANAALSVSAYYRELRNMVQYRRFNNAYPITYNSFDNIDFGTVKGFSLAYDMRRIKQLQLNASYTLQFATATGSDFSSSRGVVDNLQGAALLRTLLPVGYDQRHRITASLDYRYGQEFGGRTKGPAIKLGEKVYYPLADAGANMTFILGSGTPYSRQLGVTSILDGQPSGGQTLGTPNSNRLPWQFRTDLRLDKNFVIPAKKEDGREYGINVNLNILNLFNTQNIVGVYRFTGLPFNDGFLQSPQGEQTIISQINAASFVDLYGARLNNPNNVTMPRRIRLGVIFNF